MEKEQIISKLDALVEDQAGDTQKWKDSLRESGEALDNLLTSQTASSVEQSSVLGGIVRSLNQVLDTQRHSLGNDRRKTVESIIQSSETYLKLQELWPQIEASLKESTADSLTEVFSPENYKGVLDSIFGYGDLPAMIGFYRESINTLESYKPGLQNLAMPLEEFMKKSTEILPNLLSGNFPKVFDIMTDFQKGFEDTASRLWHLPVFGTDKQKLITEASFKILRSHGQFLIKLAEMQHVLYKTSLVSAKRLFTTVGQSSRLPKDFDEFFDLWAGVNEDTFVDLFRSQAYAKLQGELVGAALDVRSEYNHILELYLEDTPIVVRSEMDDLYKTVYQMKKRIRQLEKTTKKIARNQEALPEPSEEDGEEQPEGSASEASEMSQAPTEDTTQSSVEKGSQGASSPGQKASRKRGKS